MRNLPPNVYLNSYLQKAGVRFDVNVVDTVVRKGFGFSFYLFLVLFTVLLYCFLDNTAATVFHNYLNFYVLVALVVIYLLLYIYRVCKFNRLRRKLRMDSAPIVVEAYAIVILDTNPLGDKIVKAKRSAVLYKECGSAKPRFFTGAVRKGLKHHYYKDQIARVFIDRKNSALYTVDDDKFYATSSAKNLFGKRYSIGELATKMDKVSQKI